jgi:hypothetical protein
MVLLATTALAGCATTNPPPEISYDNAAPAVQTVDPPAPVTVVELPRPLPLPGQLQRVEETRRTPEPTNPTARVNQANEAARVQPVRDGFINSMQVYPWTQGALYQVYTAVGQITDIALQPGEHFSPNSPNLFASFSRRLSCCFSWAGDLPSEMARLASISFSRARASERPSGPYRPSVSVSRRPFRR